MHEHTSNCDKVKYQTVVSGQNGFNTNTKEIARWRSCASTTPLKDYIIRQRGHRRMNKKCLDAATRSRSILFLFKTWSFYF